MELYTAQERFALPAAGTCRVDESSQEKPCVVYVLRIGNKALRSPQTPTVFFSGTLHGNERVGPTATVGISRWI